MAINGNKDHLAQWLEEFLNRRSLEPSNLIVVTTNFDLVIETLLEDIFGTGSYYYPGVSPCSPDQRIPVFKLHGSINWMENRGRNDEEVFRRGGDEIILARPSLTTLTRSPWDKSGYFFERDRSKYTPIVVPFLFQKYAWLSENNRRWKEIFDKLWAEAEVGIRSSQRVLFWGYSLPPADYHMFSFLYQVLDGSKVECEVVEKLESETDDTKLIKLVKLFGNHKPTFRNGLIEYLTTS